MKNRGKRAMPAAGPSEFSQSRQSATTRLKMWLARTPYHWLAQPIGAAGGRTDVLLPAVA